MGVSINLLDTPIFFIILLEDSLPFANLHIADIGAVDSEADGGAYLVETIGARSTRVDVEKVVDGVEDDLQYVGMSCDKDVGLELLDAGNSLG